VPKTQRPSVPISEYVQALTEQGYTFRLNESTGNIEANGKPMDDFDWATIRAEMRARGFVIRGALKDIIMHEASQHRYDPRTEGGCQS
jgi:hypothetical protein